MASRWPPYGPEQNRVHTRISKDCFNQPFPMRYQWKANRIDNFISCGCLSLILHRIQTNLRLLQNLPWWADCWNKLFQIFPCETKRRHNFELFLPQIPTAFTARCFAFTHTSRDPRAAGLRSCIVRELSARVLCFGTTLYRCSALKVNVLSVLHRSQESLRALFANANPQKKWKWKSCDSR